MSFSAKLNYWRNRSQGSPVTSVMAEDLNRFEKGHKDAHDALDGRLSEESLDARYAPVSAGVPADGSNGQVLTKTAQGFAWAAASGGGSGFDGGQL